MLLNGCCALGSRGAAAATAVLLLLDHVDHLLVVVLCG